MRSPTTTTPSKKNTSLLFPTLEKVREITRTTLFVHSNKNEDSNDDDDDDISALYEIPVARQQLPPLTSEDSLSQPADISSLANATSTDDVSDDVLDASSPVGHPPPLPPRKDPKVSESGSRSSVSTMEDKPPDLPLRHPALEKKVSESGSRSSVNNSDDKPPELPFRPPQLSRRSEISQRSKSDVSGERNWNIMNFVNILLIEKNYIRCI